MNDANRSSVGHYRWVICACLFFATTINYVDRAVFGVLEPELHKIIGWTATQFGIINASFNAGLRHRLSLRRLDDGQARHAARLRDFADRLVARGRGPCVGRQRAGASPSRASRWASASPAISRPRSRPSPNGSPKRNAPSPPASSTPAPTSARFSRPPPCPDIFEHYGWQAAFIATGLVGLVWVFFWWPIYRRPQEHPRLSPAELAYIESDPPDPPIKMPLASSCCRSVRRGRSPSANSSPIAVWWFYLFWFAKFMNEQFGVEHQDDRPADDHRLPAGRRRLDCRRLAELLAAGPRLDDQRRAQNRDAHLRICVVRARSLAETRRSSAGRSTPNGSPCC